MRVFLASTSGKQKAIEELKPKYILETFFKGEKACKQALDNAGNENFLLDSGAFSYMNGAKVTKEEMQEYVNRYIAFIRKYDVKYYFEIDVDNIFGLDQVEMWRKQIEDSTNKKCIPVWHKGRGVEYFKQMCDNYNYIAIGGLVFHVMKQEYHLIKKLVDYAWQRGVKVHGLGFTKTKELKNYKFYSVDSASWIRGAALGQQMNFFVKDHIEQRAVNKNGYKVDINKLAEHNMSEWCKYQRYMDMFKWR